MATRYDDKFVVLNAEEIYKDHFRSRGIKHINQYTSPTLTHPTFEQVSAIDRIPHVWTIGDRYYKLADKHYDNSTLWWVIAWYNQMPTEAHVQLGDTIYIPLPLHKILSLLRNT